MTDIDILEKQLTVFFKQDHAKEMLEFLSENECGGWEKWLQFEFAKHLTLRHQCETYWEDVQSINGQHRLARRLNFLDLVYRNFNCLNNDWSYICIEFQVSTTFSNAIRHMLKDFQGVRSLQSAGWAYRSVFCVTFFKSDALTNPGRKFPRFYNALCADRTFSTRTLDYGYWTCLAIGFECDGLARNVNEARENKVAYNNFFENIKQLAISHEIEI